MNISQKLTKTTTIVANDVKFELKTSTVPTVLNTSTFVVELDDDTGDKLVHPSSSKPKEKSWEQIKMERERKIRRERWLNGDDDDNYQGREYFGEYFEE